MRALITSPLPAAMLLLFMQSPVAGAATPDAVPAATEVGVIGATPYTFAELPASARAAVSESQRRYEQRLRQLAVEHRRELHALVEQQAGLFLDTEVLRQEAEKQHLSVEQLEKKLRKPPVSDAEVKSFYEQNKEQINQPLAEVSARIREHLEQQAADRAERAYKDQLRTKYHARVTLEPLREEVAAEGPSRGPADARVTIVEFSDFQCPYCLKIEPRLQQLLEKYPREVRLVYRELPLAELHPDAMNAAKAGVCADEQGKFWPMHDALFANPKAMRLEQLQSTAARLRLDPQRFAACLDSAAAVEVIQKDTDASNELAIPGTPGMFINGRFMYGAVSFQELESIVTDELQRKQGDVTATTEAHAPAGRAVVTR
jgi:protein-disulfide isomerase